MKQRKKRNKERYGRKMKKIRAVVDCTFTINIKKVVYVSRRDDRVAGGAAWRTIVENGGPKASVHPTNKVKQFKVNSIKYDEQSE